jgi:hypothetical protein
MMSYIAKAIKKLKPTAEFSFNNDDYSTIHWDVLAGDAPSQSEIDAAIKQIKADELAAKAAAEAKLAALGLTTDDLKALGL